LSGKWRDNCSQRRDFARGLREGGAGLEPRVVSRNECALHVRVARCSNARGRTRARAVWIASARGVMPTIK